MRQHEIEEIIACLPQGRTLFHYFKDRYALLLLSDLVGDGMSISEVRRSPFARLLEKPAVRGVLARAGDGRITPRWLDTAWPRSFQTYALTLARWGSEKDWYRWWNQTTRRGGNLVLQLNFSREHDRSFDRLAKSERVDSFNSSAHPVCEDGRHTLAWSRLDIDLMGGEALIEEIQSDWIREAQSWARVLKGLRDDESKRLNRYVERVLHPYSRTWDEAMLAATIWFLRHELGMERIFLHEYRSGCRLKSIGRDAPPRSLYTRLPKRFCFQETQVGPEFLNRGRQDNHLKKALKERDLRWFLLEM